MEKIRISRIKGLFGELWFLIKYIAVVTSAVLLAPIILKQLNEANTLNPQWYWAYIGLAIIITLFVWPMEVFIRRYYPRLSTPTKKPLNSTEHDDIEAPGKAKPEGQE